MKKSNFRPILLLLLGISLFSSTKVCLADPTPATFSGKRAFDHVEKLVSFGPRPPGTQGAQLAKEYIIKTLRRFGLAVEEDDFKPRTPLGDIPMKNIIGKARGKSEKVVIIASHYDTKRFTDFKFVGANDGGSSSGILLELARILSKKKKAFTYWFVFFDGEESLAPGSNISDLDGLYGSKHLAQKLSETGRLAQLRALILLDMVGDKDLTICKERNSTPALIELFWQSAAELGYAEHFLSQSKSLVDDHLPFVERGISAIDIIDFDYGFSNVYWHSPEDTLDKISSRSLDIVGKVVLRGLEKMK